MELRMILLLAVLFFAGLTSGCTLGEALKTCRENCVNAGATSQPGANVPVPSPSSVPPQIVEPPIPSGNAKHYYIDYLNGSDSNSGATKQNAWKFAPGMRGFGGSYTHGNGDVFVFRGGVRWPRSSFPWVVSSGGAPGAPDIYTSDRTWYTGSQFVRPVFDGESFHPGSQGMFNVENLGYLHLNDLEFTRCGASQVADSDKCLVFSNTHDVSLTNNIFTTYSWIAVYFVFTDSRSHSNFLFSGNDWSHTSGAIWFASAAPGTTMHNITYIKNTFHDFSSQIGGGVHGDGAMHFYVVPASDSSQYGDNLIFCNNRFYGDFRNSFGGGGGMTAFFFVEGGLSGIICNNDMSFSPVQSNMFDGLIVLSAEGNSRATSMKIVNNSLANIGPNAMSAGIHLVGNYRNVDIRNNIAFGMQYPVFVEDIAGAGSSLVSDYNLWSGSSGYMVWGSNFQSYSQWQNHHDTNSILGGDPGWVLSPENQHLASLSRAIGRGVNLSSNGINILNSDLDGFERPSTGMWDLGCYQH